MLPQREPAKLASLALAMVAEAEKRIANLQARIDYLEALSTTDELTGLFNRRGFANQLDRALATARRGGPQGALLVCDLDRFKAVNDGHGHPAGDEVLRQVARLLAGQVRQTDAVARLGGDEFAVLLVGASEAGARQKAAMFRQLIGDGPFIHETAELSVGVSIGCAFYTGAECSEALFRRADKAMYANKRSARRMPRPRPRLAVA
ncbi:MAG: GGDEF domain-containing protein [Alphaproteobacteria bacterium]|nr:GGDEF domain-containing protein [Alphaproteobacteria bacterium]